MENKDFFPLETLFILNIKSINIKLPKRQDLLFNARGLMTTFEKPKVYKPINIKMGQFGRQLTESQLNNLDHVCLQESSHFIIFGLIVQDIYD